MKERYAITMINTGGRSGEVHNAEKTISWKIAPPGSGVPEATNPEQLFAAGFSACFNSALSAVLKRDRIQAQSTVSVTVTLYERAPLDYLISAKIQGHVEGMDKDQTQEMLEKAHQVCPYSKATSGNIEVTIEAV